MNIIKVNDEPALFDRKKEVIARLNVFIKKFAEVNSLDYRLIPNEVRNSNGSFIELVSIKFEDLDRNMVWFKTYSNLIVPTVESLLFKSIFPGDTVIQQLNAEFRKMNEQSSEIYTTAVNSSNRAGGYNW